MIIAEFDKIFRNEVGNSNSTRRSHHLEGYVKT
jgi:hypothetical protein